MDNSAKFWDKRSGKYDSQVNTIYAQTYEATIHHTKKYLKPTDMVLDYACGTGITTVELARSVKKIIAVDISENMINIARSKSREHGIPNIEYHVIDIFSDKFIKGSFDVVLGFNILYFLKDIDKTLTRIYELLKPDGFFISATDCLGEKKTMIGTIQLLLSKTGIIPYIRRFKTSELQEIIEAHHFSILETENLYDSPPNFYIAAKKENQ